MCVRKLSGPNVASHKCTQTHVAVEMWSQIKRKFCNVPDKHMIIGQWSFDTAKSKSWAITKSRPICCDVCRWSFHLTCYTFGCSPWIMDLTMTINTEECVSTCRLRKYDSDIHIDLEVRFPQHSNVLRVLHAAAAASDASWSSSAAAAGSIRQASNDASGILCVVANLHSIKYLNQSCKVLKILLRIT